MEWGRGRLFDQDAAQLFQVLVREGAHHALHRRHHKGREAAKAPWYGFPGPVQSYIAHAQH